LTFSERLAEKVAGSRAGRAVLSVAIVVLVASLIAWNLPPGIGPASAPGSSALRRDVLYAGGPLIYALGLDQDWDVFAPPRVQVIKLEAKVKFANGAQTVWRPPTSLGALFGAYRDYRWGKYAEMAIADANSSIWQPLAEWVAREHTSPGRRPAVVTLIRQFYNINPVVSGTPDRGPWMRVAYYVYHVPARSQ
jgi:hypothetical protein